VLLGKGDGTFRPAVNYATGPAPSWVAVGDFNGDGIPDLAVATDTVSVLLGKGDGTFKAAVSYAAGDTPFALGVGDFNRDGSLDLAVANSGADTVSILLGKGNGTFQRPIDYAVGVTPVSTVVADFNGDGIPDLAVVFLGGVRVVLGNGDGTFQTTPISYIPGAAPTAVAVIDANGDGLPDLAVANLASNDVSILLNDGNWPSPPGAAPAPPHTRTASGEGGSAHRSHSVQQAPFLATTSSECWPAQTSALYATRQEEAPAVQLTVARVEAFFVARVMEDSSNSAAVPRRFVKPMYDVLAVLADKQPE
jgi:hypothetical protein